MLQDHKAQKTDRSVFLKLQTLLVETLAQNHDKLFMGNDGLTRMTEECPALFDVFIDMARHISSSFRSEYIQAGQQLSSSTKSTTDEISTNNKRKDLSPTDREVSSPKVAKSKVDL